MTEPDEIHDDLAPHEIVKLRAAVEARTEAVVVEQIGLARATFARALAGLPVHRGSLAQIRSFLRLV